MPTAIQWTDETWNPVTGCTKVSPGCAHCYISSTPPFRMEGRRFVAGATDLRLHHDRLEQPLRWRKPRRVFVNSLSDLFHEGIPDEFIERVFVVMARAPQHTFQVLTKRPERARALLNDPGTRNFIVNRATSENTGKARSLGWTGMLEGAQPAWPLPNVWIGVSIENDRHVFRADLLRETPAAVRFISAEPLLGPLPSLGLAGIDWVIVGGESGRGARPFHLHHARAVIGAAVAESYDRSDFNDDSVVAVFVKQLGANPMAQNSLELLVSGGEYGGPVPLTLRHPKGGDPDEWPADLRIREYPTAR